MASAVLVCLLFAPSWGGDAAFCDVDHSGEPLFVANPYVRPEIGIGPARYTLTGGSVPLRIRNPFVPVADDATEEPPSQNGSFIGHKWGRFTAVRVYPSRKE